MGDGNEDRMGLIRKLGEATATKIKQYNDHRELLADKSIEAVVIAVPLNRHAPLAMEALNAGKHVLSEKLMAHDITQCKQPIRKAKKRKLLLAVGHQRHYSVLYDNANHIVREGLLGDVKFIRAQWHRNNSFPNRDSWHKAIPGIDNEGHENRIKDYGFDSMERLINWRLYNETGGELMAELGSHQMDACSIFLGKKHPLAVQGYGGKNFYGVKGVGSKDKQEDDREIDDHIYVTFEFPGPHYEQDPKDICIVTYSSISTNRLEPYGETVFGSRGTLIVHTEKEALLFKEESPTSAGGGLEQRIFVVNSTKGGRPGARSLRNQHGRPRLVRCSDFREPRLQRGDGALLLLRPAQHLQITSGRRPPLPGHTGHGRRDHGPHGQPRDEAQKADRLQTRVVRRGQRRRPRDRPGCDWMREGRGVRGKGKTRPSAVLSTLHAMARWPDNFRSNLATLAIVFVLFPALVPVGVVVRPRLERVPSRCKRSAARASVKTKPFVA